MYVCNDVSKRPLHEALNHLQRILSLIHRDQMSSIIHGPQFQISNNFVETRHLSVHLPRLQQCIPEYKHDYLNSSALS